MKTDRPIENCYWVSPGLFLAGEYPRTLDDESTAAKLQLLVNAGVSAFIDLTEDWELLPYSQFLGEYESRRVSHQRFPIRDVSVPHSSELVVEVLDSIDGHIREGRMVYLHCWGGVGRTGVIVGCWLARHGWHGDAALSRLSDLWQHCPKSAKRASPETVEQENYVKAWRESR